MCPTDVLRVILLVCIYIGYSESRNSYLFIAPRVVRPGRVLSVQGSLLEVPSGGVTLTADLLSANKQTIASTRKEVFDDQGVDLDIQVPRDLKSDSYSLRLTGSGALNFEVTKALKYEAKSTSVFIQTDKYVYKPGQTVHFRIFGVTPELKVVFDKLKVELFDPKGNKINQWDVSNAGLTERGGVWIEEQVMSNSPVLGDWKLKASLAGETEEKIFKVDEYVLPKFETELDLPAFGRTKDTEFEGKVKAKYTFGKPVKGRVNLRVKPERERFTWKNGARQKISKEIEMDFPIHGEATFTLRMTQLKEIQPFLNNQILVFEANVTESLTNSVQSDRQEIRFYDKAYKLEFAKSLPDTFKVGMPYQAVVKISQQDGSPPGVTGQLKVTVTEYRKSKYIRPPPFFRSSGLMRRSWMPPRPRPFPVETSKTLSPEYHTIPADGVVQFPVHTSSSVIRLSVKAEYDGIRTTLSLKKRHSPSDSFLQIEPQTESAVAGMNVNFVIRTTSSRSNTATYQVFSKGKIVQSGSIQLSGSRTTLPLTVTSSMAPRTRLVVFYVRRDGEVVADALTFNVQGIFQNKVSVQFNSTSARPADGIALDISAQVGSTVNILGVDKSVLLMGTGNDVTKDQVLEELQLYQTKGTKSSSSGPICGWWCWRWPIPVGGKDVKDVFDEAGVVVLTDALIYEHIEPRPIPKRRISTRRRGGWGVRMFNRALPMARGEARAPARQMKLFKPLAADMGGAGRIQSLGVDVTNLKPVERTRKIFPETWLWTDTTIPSSGTATIRETVPDTITSWITSAFAIHPESGLGITESSAQLQVSMPFFISVQMPYSVVRGEKVIIQANIFNYNSEPVFTRVALSQSNEFNNIHINGAQETVSSSEVSRTLTVNPNEVEAVYFPIIPTKIGRVTVVIRAQSATMSDEVKKELLVEAEGSPREYNLPVFIDLKDQGSFTTTRNVEFPITAVKGSERVTLTVIGDMMGPSISGIDKLLKMPYGCGEQNMLNFAPNIFILKYLEATNNIDEAIMTKAKKFMVKGYQQELKYKHSDGSFSAFGDRDTSGSMWLTAFVVKSFVQAKPYTFIDDSIVNKAIDWMIKRQNSKGTFPEPGRVIHKAMQGGSTSGEVSLTAYVLVSLLEARAIAGVDAKIQAAEQKAVTFLESQISLLEDVYDLAIVSYALEMAASPQATVVWAKLDAKAQTEGGMKYWEKNVKPTTTVKPWAKSKGQAVNIELTAYALLTLVQRQDRTQGIQVVKWLTEQRNPHGGFSSTQDTVVALHALSEMASLLYSSIFDLTISITGTGFTDTLTIDNTNALLLQSRELPIDVGAVTVSANGRGIGLVQIQVSYNIDDDDQKESFSLTVVILHESMNDFQLKVCASYLGEGGSSMAIIEVGSPSGFIADPSSVESNPPEKDLELEEKKIVLYYEEIDRTDTCVTLTARRIGLVAGARPVPVRVYDYYEPTKQVTTFYAPQSLSNSNVCQVCVNECNLCVKPGP